MYASRSIASSRDLVTDADATPQTELSVIGAQMGAQVKLDLTSDVTHLIVGNTNSAKYRYVAKAREDVKVLLPEWMHALQKVWMTGEDVNTSELEGQWTLPTFYGLRICLTGFDDRTIPTPLGESYTDREQPNSADTYKRRSQEMAPSTTVILQRPSHIWSPPIRREASTSTPSTGA